MIGLLSPPFFRFAGSHNDRVPMEFAYASEYLEEFGIEHVVVNSDYVGSKSYVPWSDLLHNFGGFMGGEALFAPSVSVYLPRERTTGDVRLGSG